MWERTPQGGVGAPGWGAHGRLAPMLHASDLSHSLTSLFAPESSLLSASHTLLMPTLQPLFSLLSAWQGLALIPAIPLHVPDPRPHFPQDQGLLPAPCASNYSKELRPQTDTP